MDLIIILLEKAIYKDKIYWHGMLNLGLNILTRLVWGNYKVNLEHLLGPESKESLNRKIVSTTHFTSCPNFYLLEKIYKIDYYTHLLSPTVIFHVRNSEKIITRSKMTCVRNIRN